MKMKYVLFMLAATVFNIVVTVICFIILSFLYTVILVPRVHEETAFVGFSLLFVVSVVLSFFIYNQALKLITKKYPQLKP